MKSESPKRNLDSLAIPEGHFVELGILMGASEKHYNSPACGYRLAYFKIHANADATISFEDSKGNAVTGMAVSKGPVPYLMKKITACDQVFYVVHDGARSGTSKTMTSSNYGTRV